LKLLWLSDRWQHDVCEKDLLQQARDSVLEKPVLTRVTLNT